MTLAQYIFQWFAATPKVNLRDLPPSLPNIIHNINMACFQAGWKWREFISNVLNQVQVDWRWTFNNGKYLRKWHVLGSIYHVHDVCKTCLCTKRLCGACLCIKKKAAILPFYKFKMHCKKLIRVTVNKNFEFRYLRTVLVLLFLRFLEKIFLDRNVRFLCNLRYRMISL